MSLTPKEEETPLEDVKQDQEDNKLNVDTNVALKSKVEEVESKEEVKVSNDLKKEDSEDLEDEEMEDESDVDEEEEVVESQNEKLVINLDLKLLHQEPEFAQICSFFNAFGSCLGVTYSFPALERMFLRIEDGKASRELIDCHTALFRRLFYMKWARPDKFTNCLHRFIEGNVDLKDTELMHEAFAYDYTDIPLVSKMNLLLAVCSAQFDGNYKFKENIHRTFRDADLRLSPVGTDKNGMSFYAQQDLDFNIRVYSVEAEDKEYSTWSLRAKSLKDLFKLINELKSADYGKPKEDDIEEIEEDAVFAPVDKQNEDSQQVFSDKMTVEMAEEEREKVIFSLKKYCCFDKFRPEEFLFQKEKDKKLNAEKRKVVKNPKKVEIEEEVEEVELEEEEVDQKKEKQKKEKTPENVEDEIPEELLQDDRRVLPRRSARNAAYSNLKQFAATPRPKKKEEVKEPSEEKSEAEEEYDDEDEEEEEIGSSDDEFKMGSGKKGKRKRKFAPRKKREPKDDDDEPKKRRKPKPKPTVFEESSDEEEVEDNEPKERKKATEKTLCMHCKKSTRPDVLLLCDECDDAWHIWCLKPALKSVPDGDWFCPKCNHNTLIARLSVVFIDVQEALKERKEQQRLELIALEEAQRKYERAQRRDKFNGIDMRNIVNTQEEEVSIEEEEEAIDDGQRKSKKRAMRQFTHTTSRSFQPLITVAEGRSRRQLNKVDYNFQDYDEQIFEAMDETSSQNDGTSGLGRGKDMRNIMEAERNSQQGSETGETPSHAGKKKPKKAKKLTDMDVDNITESDTDEYNEEEAHEEEEEIPSEDEYVPSDEGRNKRGGRRSVKTRSDDEFIDDSDSDFEVSPRKKKKGASQKRKAKGGGRDRGRNKRARYDDSEEETEEEEEWSDESGDSDIPKKNRKAKPAARKWAPKASSSESDDDIVDEEEESDDGGPVSGTGRPLRKAATELEKKLHQLDELDKELDEEENVSLNDKVVAERAVGRPRARMIMSDDDDEADEFQVDDDEEEAEEEAELEEELAKELDEKRQKKTHKNEGKEEHEEETEGPKKLTKEKSPEITPEPKIEALKRISKPKSPTKPKSPSKSAPKPRIKQSTAPQIPPSTSTENTSIVKPIIQLATPSVSHLPMPPHNPNPYYTPPPPHGYPPMPMQLRSGEYPPPLPHLQRGPYDYYPAPGMHHTPHFMPPPVYAPPIASVYQPYPPQGYPPQLQPADNIAQLQPMRTVDNDSLSHVLGGALNPDSL